MTNILLADDHAVIRAGMVIFIKHHVPHSVIDEAWDGDSSLEKIKEKDYDLIILDINMPNTDSFGLVSNILSLKPESKILMCSMNSEELYAKKYLQLGAKGYLNKGSSETEFKKALDTVLNNMMYVSPSLNQIFAQDVLGKKPNNPFEKLSPREFEIILHLVKGETLSQICTALNLQTSTVGTHKARIFGKLKCKNILEVNQLAQIYNVIPQA